MRKFGFLCKLNLMVYRTQPGSKNKKTPTVGLEPTTTRLRALRSTDWARRACCVGLPFHFIRFSRGNRLQRVSSFPSSKNCCVHQTSGIQLRSSCTTISFLMARKSHSIASSIYLKSQTFIHPTQLFNPACSSSNYSYILPPKPEKTILTT